MFHLLAPLAKLRTGRYTVVLLRYNGNTNVDLPIIAI